MHTRSGVDASPYKEGSSANFDGEGVCPERGEGGQRRGWKRSAGRKHVSFTDEGQTSSTKPPNKSPLRSAPDKQQGCDVKKPQANRDEPFQHRFSVHRIRDAKFNEQQKHWIEEAGFGALLRMQDVSLPLQLVAHVMTHISTDLREFRVSEKKSFAFDKQLICNILGVPSGEVPVKLTCTAAEYEEFQKIRALFMGPIRGLCVTDCQELMQKSTDKATFLRAFMLLALGSVLCPNLDNCISVKYLHSLHDVSSIRSYDRAGHILDELMDAVKKIPGLYSQKSR